MGDREIPMNMVKELGPNKQYQCACGRKFHTNDESGQNKVLHNGKTCPKCPDCKGVYTGSKLSDFQQAIADQQEKMFSACVAYNGNKCKGKFIGEFSNMAEFTMAVGASMMSLGLPMDGIEIKEVDEAEYERHKEEYHMASRQDDILAHLMAMMTAHGMKPPGKGGYAH